MYVVVIRVSFARHVLRDTTEDQPLTTSNSRIPRWLDIIVTIRV